MPILIRGYTAGNELFYVYLALKVDKVIEFQRAMQKEQVRFSDYGMVIAEGLGNPPVEVMQQFEEMFDYSHGDLLDMTEALTTERTDEEE